MAGRLAHRPLSTNESDKKADRKNTITDQFNYTATAHTVRTKINIRLSIKSSARTVRPSPFVAAIRRSVR